MDRTTAANTRENFERLLGEMLNAPERRAELTGEIERIFGQRRAVLILDMSGFSRTTQQHGILTFLLMIHQMQRICRPCIEQSRGILIKADADNLFCLFDTVEDAIEAAREITRRLDTANQALPGEHQLYVAFGIGYGSILNIADQDLFGDEVNLACKLGEDLARKRDVLLTAAARASLSAFDEQVMEEVVSISGITLTYYSFNAPST
jgi:class 3 adenylate cyclase